MSLTLAEGLIDALKTYIEANITAKLTALDTEYPDAIVLEVPVTTYVGIKSLKSIMTYPAMFIVSEEQEFEPKGPSGGKDWPVVMVGIVAVEQESETLQRRVYRYRRALIELLLSANLIADGWVISTGDKWQSGAFVDDLAESTSSELIGTAVVQVRASSGWQEL